MTENKQLQEEIELKRKAHREYCSDNTPNFAEFGTNRKGNCRYCNQNIWEYITLKKASSELITGCPVCHRSYCD